MVVRVRRKDAGEFQGWAPQVPVCCGQREKLPWGPWGRGIWGEVRQREEMVMFLESLTQDQGSRLRCEGGFPGDSGVRNPPAKAGDPWSRKIPHSVGQRSPHALEPVFHHEGRHRNKSAHHNKE